MYLKEPRAKLVAACSGGGWRVLHIFLAKVTPDYRILLDSSLLFWPIFSPLWSRLRPAAFSSEDMNITWHACKTPCQGHCWPWRSTLSRRSLARVPLWLTYVFSLYSSLTDILVDDTGPSLGGSLRRLRWPRPRILGRGLTPLWSTIGLRFGFAGSPTWTRPDPFPTPELLEVESGSRLVSFLTFL